MKISTDRLLDLNQKDLESCAFAKEVLKNPGRKDGNPKPSTNSVVKILGGLMKPPVALPMLEKSDASLFVYLDLPKGAEWRIRGAYTPSFRIKQHPLEDAGI